LTSLPEKQQQHQQPPYSAAPVSVPYDVNQIKAKKHQIYTDSVTNGGGGGLSPTKLRLSSSTSCVFRESLGCMGVAPAYQHPPSHYGSSVLLPLTRQSSTVTDTDADSGIEKEASSDSSSLYGSDVSSGGGNSWELLGRSGGGSEERHESPSSAEASRNPLASQLYNNRNGSDSLVPLSLASPAAAAAASTHHRGPPEAKPSSQIIGGNNNKWDYREVKHRMRSRASSLDNVKLGESRKWSLPSAGGSALLNSADQHQSPPHRKSSSDSVQAKSLSHQAPLAADPVTPPTSSKGTEKKLTSFLRGHVRSVSFGRGALTLPGRKSSNSQQKVKSESTSTGSAPEAKAAPPSVQFQIGHSTRYIPGRENENNCSRSPSSLPPSGVIQQQQQQPPPMTKQYRLLRLIKDESGELGILITLKRGVDGSQQGYVIGHVEPGGVADRYLPSFLSTKLVSI
jgi:hypothetical protein